MNFTVFILYSSLLSSLVVLSLSVDMCKLRVLYSSSQFIQFTQLVQLIQFTQSLHKTHSLQLVQFSLKKYYSLQDN